MRRSIFLFSVLMASLGSVSPAAAESAAIITLDDSSAINVGDWVQSAKQTHLIGEAYMHDNNHDQGGKSARFTTTIIDGGEYEVRLLYVATSNRATKVPVQIAERMVTINQREECIIDGVPRALGVFKLASGSELQVTISNKDADGFVVVDGLQIVLLEVAKAERAGRPKTAFAKMAKI